MSTRLAFENLSKRYGSLVVFTGFSLELPLNKASCLMGPSGCGKTTLLRLFMGLERPDAGQVFVPDAFSAVFQEDRLQERLSASGNLRLVTGKKSNTAASTLLVELGLDPDDRKPVREYSGGMKRRVAIARALVARPPLLLLDEPFKGLDEEARRVAAGVILRHSAGGTIVMVSHDRAEAALLSAEVFSLV